jgi:large subunit ribosomal protein LP1
MALTKEQHDELCVAYAAMILFDGEAEITSESLTNVIEASGNEVEPYWPMLFANLLSKDGKMMELITSGGPSAGASAAPAAAGGAAAAAADAPAAKEDKKKKEEEEEADLGGGMDMFGGGSDY